MEWSLAPIWNKEDVYIIGGGPSVKSFPIRCLKNKKVIGCNDAFLFGSEIVDIEFFGDSKWFDFHKIQLRKFLNPIITNSEKLANEDLEWVYSMPRKTSGFHKDAIGWNGNTGAAAINLALILGVQRIFLIGFDMKLSDDGSSNWHSNFLNSPTEIHYERYRNVVAEYLSDLLDYWPNVQFINLNPDSALECFPKKDPKTFFEGEENGSQ